MSLPFSSSARRRAVALLLGSALAAPAWLAAAAPASAPVSFRKEVLPILAHHCFKCHGDEKPKGDLNFRSRESVFGRADPIIVPGHSARSLMIELILAEEIEERMPPKGRALNREEVAILQRWIDAGAPWDDGDIRALERKPEIRLAAPTPPAGEGHPIDRWLAGYFARHRIDPAASVDDRKMARRLWYDLVGLPPPAAELAAFLADERPDKRDRLVDRLLGDPEAYAAHWMAFWQDHLRDGTRGVDEAGDPICPDHYHVRPITPWLFAALRDNKPYDQFVRELVAPPDLPVDPYADPKTFKRLPRDSSGFLQGIRMGGATPLPIQSPEIQAAQNIGQVFLGTQLKCATCHDSFIDGWKQKDVWALASVYAETPLEIFRSETPTGVHAKPGFLFPELDRVVPEAPRRTRVEQLAASLTDPRNGLLARTLVNRLWARLMGRGLIEPLDDMAEPAWHPELLDWLAADFIAHGFDVKHAIRRIVTSRAWQRPAVPAPADPQAAFVFRGPLIRRLSAEQFLDTLYLLQGRPHRAWEQQSNPLADALGRPDRQIVVTSRSNDATVLQSLEFLNGQTLHGLLYQHGPASYAKPYVNERCPVTDRRIGVEVRQRPQVVWHDGIPIGVADVASALEFERNPAAYLPKLERELRVARVAMNRPRPIPPGGDLLALATERFALALSRAPAAAEIAVMQDVFGAVPTLDDLADNTWLILMKPEFQLLQ